MSKVLIKMHQVNREIIIEKHKFYIKQAQKRLLSQFDNIQKEAEELANKYWENTPKNINFESFDPSDHAEDALEKGQEFYSLLSDMKSQTTLSVVAGMYHQWDKTLRNWLVDEIYFSNRSPKIHDVVWRKNIGEIYDLLNCLGFQVVKLECFENLDACRLLVNVYKHGQGLSLKELIEKYPQYIPEPIEGFKLHERIAHEYLQVSDQQVMQFSDAIECFWRALPCEFYISEETDLPAWFTKAWNED